MFYAPSLDCYVVARYADVEYVFLHPDLSSVANAQLPLMNWRLRSGSHYVEGAKEREPRERQ